ncbi:bifunctional adenosylcobinamide kinase/adenosylcobinamide-phosphate guanylyltransferase [Sporosarcina thermotolerans]|uniref:Adenosylcobinamide kinase n=2 Tax=Sporosarcina thermotolerans TaxID=633404 RepID=A0AAW9A644_9BACL|nr:bifunctional adenosylcobinamide kinase/adenosylcobinamide-phosphate guanylyltransferase [Sporosarcina thermotolerans]MDW0116424.1 bifunctional adenosylcobinamide kinase/adenosylcobinamide-phosphate guanylyltransferase [Sporosarcina thermotolerans]WHT48374.1 bifunctional adenosylcobinamide kinase/adenosylcobinamide-phosphate guanylyltransferase [Sporosarcina thermotolerans]
MSGKLTFISGGVRSGKSAYAEKLLIKGAITAESRLVYIASGRAVDEEMKKRIEKHQLDRAEQAWTTIEQPANLYEALPFIQQNDFVLWDCLTTWLANELYTKQDGQFCIQLDGCMENKAKQMLETVDEIRKKSAHLVIVSNEVLDEFPSPYKETKKYSEWIGRLHQKLVALSDDAIEMDYGLPQYWKREGQVAVR